MYYYAIVIKHMHPVEGKAPIPVAELMTSDHTVLSLCYFMETFRRAEGLIFGFSSITYQRSDALFSACVQNSEQRHKGHIQPLLA